MSACPSCRKPLPRCAICLMHMGTGSGLQLLSSNSNKHDDDGKLTPFNSWFTWCQTCKHGGHSEHITQWFQLVQKKTDLICKLPEMNFGEY